jgi:peptide/nickel transport system permease protein
MSFGWLAVFILRRLIVLCVLLVAVSFGVFSLLYIAPGNVIDTLLGTHPRTPQTIQFLTKEYHLDRPFLTQYWLWARDAARLRFGNSIQTTLPVTDEIRSRVPTSLFLGVYAYALTIFFGVGLGLVSALRRHRIEDRAIAAFSIVGLSTPVFVSGVFLLYLFAIVLPWFPAFGQGSGFVDELWHLTLPAASLALVSCAYVMRHTRAAVIGVVDQDYVTFARARGLPWHRILFAYTLRNALIPVVTIAGLIFAFLITGAVLVETTFSLPGLGRLLVQSATVKDLPMIQGVAILIAIFIMVTNLLTDIAYMLADPRIRLGRKGS